MTAQQQILGTLPVVNSALAVVAVRGKELAVTSDLARVSVKGTAELAIVRA